MNIFILDLNHKKCARYHCDKHLVKMITEHNQILGSIFYTSRGVLKKKDIKEEFILKHFSTFPRRDEYGNPDPYGIGHKNHPCTRWAASSLDNYLWLTRLTAEMCIEYTRRYGKEHAGEAINQWYAERHYNLKAIGMTPFVQVVPKDCQVPGDVVTAYRNCYNKYKSFARWQHSPTPTWYKPLVSN